MAPPPPPHGYLLEETLQKPKRKKPRHKKKKPPQPTPPPNPTAPPPIDAEGFTLVTNQKTQPRVLLPGIDAPLPIREAREAVTDGQEVPSQHPLPSQKPEDDELEKKRRVPISSQHATEASSRQASIQQHTPSPSHSSIPQRTDPQHHPNAAGKKIIVRLPPRRTTENRAPLPPPPPPRPANADTAEREEDDDGFTLVAGKGTQPKCFGFFR